MTRNQILLNTMADLQKLIISMTTRAADLRSSSDVKAFMLIQSELITIVTQLEILQNDNK